MSTGMFRLTQGENSRCEDVRLAMGEVLDGFADSTTRGAVEAHVRICLPCSREMEELKEVIERLREIATVAPKAEAWKKVEQHAARDSMPQPPEKNSTFRWLRRFFGG